MYNIEISGNFLICKDSQDLEFIRHPKSDVRYIILDQTSLDPIIRFIGIIDDIISINNNQKTEFKISEINGIADVDSFNSIFENQLGFKKGGGNGEGVASVTGSLVNTTDPNNPIINTPSANDVFNVDPVITDINPTQQSVNEQAWTMQRLGDIGITRNPTFHLGRIINGGINEPKWRILFRDDLEYITEVPCFELEPSGTVASLRQIIGSHYEGFIGTEVEPMFRVASTDLGGGNRGSRIELGSGDNNSTDVFLEKTGSNEFRIVLSGGTKQIWYSDAVFTPANIMQVLQDSATPSPAGNGTIKLYSKNGLLHHMNNSGDESTLVYQNRVLINQSNAISILGGTIDSTKQYFIDGIIDMGTTSITVPSTGMTIKGYSFDTSGLISSEDNYTLFTGSTAGNLIMNDLKIEVTGTSSQVFNLIDTTNTKAIEILAVNYNGCTSLGEITGYRQILESDTGRFGGTPELTLSGVMNGVRITTSIVRGISNITSLFKTGTNLTLSGRFILDINCDLPTTGSLIDLSDTNIINNDSLILENCFITRSGTVNASDPNISPNIDDMNVKSLWKGNTGIPNTVKYIKANITTELPTVIATANTYTILAGNYTVEQDSHFDMPANGEFRLLSGNGTYSITGDYVLDSTQNNEVDIRVMKSTDGGLTYTEQVNSIRRVINNLGGGAAARDIGFFPINFITVLSEGDRLRIEVENRTAANNITAEIESYFIITQA